MLEKLQNLVAIEVFFVSLQIRKVKVEVGGGFFSRGPLVASMAWGWALIQGRREAPFRFIRA